jgi:hypothetical protein
MIREAKVTSESARAEAFLALPKLKLKSFKRKV